MLLLFSTILTACAHRAAIPLTRVEWNPASLRRVSSNARREGYNAYARLIQLRDSSLLCAYEAAGGIVICRSNDLGDAWSEPLLAAPSEPGLCFTVPDILQLRDGVLLLCYNPRPCPPAPGKRFAIRTRRSIDGGLSWTDERVVHEAGEKFTDGCWEPSAIQLPNGEVRLFFANEGPYTNTNEQEISMCTSRDGGLSWSPKPVTIAFRKGARDGMPSPLFLPGSNEIVVAIEDNGAGAFKPFIVRGPASGVWQTVGGDSSQRHSALGGPLPADVYAGAPCLRRLHTGETILSWQATDGRSGNPALAAMRVAVGTPDARNFAHVTTPFDIPIERAGMWNSLAILSDDTIVALTSTDTWSPGEVEVWMIKGRLVR